MKEENANPTDVEVELAAFPPKHAQNGFQRLLKLFQTFLSVFVRTARPRSWQDGVICYSALMSYRKSLIFWAKRQYKLRSPHGHIPTHSELHKALTDTIRMLSKTHKVNSRGKRSKTYLGLPELQQLMDMDMRDTLCIGLAECHELAWVISRVTACRPGALGSPKSCIIEDFVNKMDPVK